MFIINQDRDRIINVKKSDLPDALLTVPKFYKDVCMGINLYYKNTLLGTFDTVQDAIEEMNSIIICKRRFYCVRGHEPFELWERIKLVMLGGDSDEMAD
ncbi:MAG: hypothetical protein Q8873_00440 [Bacillota bacterium]|nr:hypothetical protein [Bacillota bacterium]